MTMIKTLPIYLVISRSDTYDLMKAVNAEIERGFRPIGGVAVEVRSSGFGTTKENYLQAMLKE